MKKLKNCIIARLTANLYGDFSTKPEFEVILSKNVQSIGNRAFYYCSIKSITIPDSVLKIGRDAFDKDSSHLIVSRNSYAAQYCSEMQLDYSYPDSNDWLNDGAEEDDADLEKVPMNIASEADETMEAKEDGIILKEETIMKLVSSCPSLSKLSYDTKNYYSSTAYKEIFSNQDGKIHTWFISIQSGMIVISDEKVTITLPIKTTGNIAEIAPVQKWEVELLEAIPEIKTVANNREIQLIAEKRVEGGDYALYADENGVIDILDESKYNAVLDIARRNLKILSTIDVFGELGELDKNGNGVIDPDEIFE